MVGTKTDELENTKQVLSPFEASFAYILISNSNVNTIGMGVGTQQGKLTIKKVTKEATKEVKDGTS